MLRNLKIFSDPDGILVPVDFHSLPFEPKRIFYVCDIPKGEERGNHAHYKTQQLLVCIQGKISVKLHDGKNQHVYMLHPHQMIHVPEMVWDSQVFHTGDDVLLSICSTYYDKSDYIENFYDFLNLSKEKKNESVT